MATSASANEHHETAVSDWGKGLNARQRFGLVSPDNTLDLNPV